MTNDMCGIDGTVSCVVIPPRWGWHVINTSFPRAMPWAITFGAFGAEEKYQFHRAFPWAITFGAFGAEEKYQFHRAMPWAITITFSAFGVEERRQL